MNSVPRHYRRSRRPKQYQVEGTLVSIAGDCRHVDLNRGARVMTLIPRREALRIAACLLEELVGQEDRQ